MNFQEKLLEASSELRTRTAALAASALERARSRATLASKGISVLNVAGRELNKVARRHAVRFVKQNSTIAAAVRKDVTDLARTTYASLAPRTAPKKARRATTARKRAAKAA
jgi:hypothetical protein